MCLRRCLSAGLIATLLGCGVGVSGLESVNGNPPLQGERVEAPTLDASSSDEGGGDIVANGLADAAAPKRAGGGASSSDAGVTTGMPSSSRVDAAADSAGSLVDAPVVDPATVGCPDRAVCPAGEVCCALFRDGGVPAFDDAGALETLCRPSCTVGTTPLCAADADCGDAGLCYRNPSISSRGFCAPASPYYPRFPYGDGG